MVLLNHFPLSLSLSLLSSLFLYRQNSDYCRKKGHDSWSKRNHGDEINKAKQVETEGNHLPRLQNGKRLPSFLGMVKMWQAGWSVVQSLLRGRWWALLLLWISALVCKCKQFSVPGSQFISALSTLAELSSRREAVSGALCHVHTHASGRKCQCTRPLLPSQASFMRQNVFSCMTEGRFSKQTPVSIVLNMLHVHVRKQNAVIS